MNYFMLPGNPPATHFYELWREEFLHRLPLAQVKVSPYPLLERGLDSESAMNLVTEYHISNLRKFHQETGQKANLLGHSLGGHFALKILERESDLVDKVVLLFPFLRKPDSRGSKILNIFGALYPYEILHLTLMHSKKYLSRIFTELAHLTDEELLKTLHLVKHERETIAKNDGPVVIPPEHRTKVHVFYVKVDSWCTPKVLGDLRTQVSMYERQEPHSFILKAEDRRSLLTKILEL